MKAKDFIYDKLTPSFSKGVFNVKQLSELLEEYAEQFKNICTHCNGTGHDPSYMDCEGVFCPVCKGTGKCYNQK